MSMRYAPALFRCASVLGLLLVLGACTQGGQFDPTALFSNDMFDSKKKVQGDREPVFPNGVPGTTAGVPPDLVKGYQPPPDQSADNNPAVQPAVAAAPAEKPKPKPKPKVARAPVTSQDPAFAQKPSTATRISVGPAPKPSAPAQQQTAAPGQTAWPAPTGAAPQTSQSPWPDPPAKSTQ
jgi:outer membrane biosynthesis protein TonB